MSKATSINSAVQSAGLLLLAIASGVLLLINRMIWLTGLSAVAGDANATLVKTVELVGLTPWWVFAAILTFTVLPMAYRHFQSTQILVRHMRLQDELSESVKAFRAELASNKSLEGRVSDILRGNAATLNATMVFVALRENIFRLESLADLLTIPPDEAMPPSGWDEWQENGDLFVKEYDSVKDILMAAALETEMYRPTFFGNRYLNDGRDRFGSNFSRFSEIDKKIVDFKSTIAAIIGGMNHNFKGEGSKSQSRPNTESKTQR